MTLAKLESYVLLDVLRFLLHFPIDGIKSFARHGGYFEPRNAAYQIRSTLKNRIQFDGFQIILVQFAIKLGWLIGEMKEIYV